MRLDEACELIMGQSPDSNSYNENGDGLPFFQGNADFGEVYPITRVWCNVPTKIVNPNTLLISVRAPIGALNISKDKSCIGRGLAGIVPKDDFNLKYIYYCMKAKHQELNRKGTGSTFKAISKNTLGETQVKKITLQEQNMYVQILDKVEKVIAYRKRQLEKLDTLVKARFVEMFGTYPANEKGWRTGTIRDIVTEVRYGSSRPAVTGGQYPYLRMNNITYSGELDLSDIKRIDIPASEIPKCTVRCGDVLFNRTNSKELVGKTCVYDRDEMMVLAGFVIRIRTNEQMIPEFLSAFLNTDFSKKMLLAMCKTAIGQANINAQELQNIEIYIPPVEQQKIYAAFKQQTDKSKVAVQKSLDETRLLFNRLMQEYFG
ncbi:restriction endonuclease subunit S [Enterocloster bolteae]|uniref:restriction endonuclease subunit S n=1 Tax=Enterocloster bolteae TaxID=208479 RepID=UPI002A824AA0|nr:restriction endonuclease subunit S [Enterocloster bolteae]